MAAKLALLNHAALIAVNVFAAVPVMPKQQLLTLADLEKFRYNIALPAPSLYAQFSLDRSIESILCGFLNIGFDEVFEVAQELEIVSLAIRDYLKRSDIPRPAISSACPATVQLN